MEVDSKVAVGCRSASKKSSLRRCPSSRWLSVRTDAVWIVIETALRSISSASSIVPDHSWKAPSWLCDTLEPTNPRVLRPVSMLSESRRSSSGGGASAGPSEGSVTTARAAPSV